MSIIVLICLREIKHCLSILNTNERQKFMEIKSEKFNVIPKYMYLFTTLFVTFIIYHCLHICARYKKNLFTTLKKTKFAVD